jgi:uncharacterized protein (DUF2141 family)
MKSAAFVAFFAAGAAAAPAPAADLTIAIDGVRSDSGYVMVAVYDRPDTFRKEGQEVAATRLSVKRSAGKVTLFGLPPGGYAVAAFHDENGDGKLDTNLLGQPVEGYGFSNNARGTFGPPSYADAKFDLPPAGASITLKLSY